MEDGKEDTKGVMAWDYAETKERIGGHMRTAIVTDSNSGIFEREGKELGIYVVAMPVIIGGKTYYEGSKKVRC